MRVPKPEMRKARIEIIPMIDTIFFLLVFFMMATLSMAKMNGMALTMPRDSHNAPKPASQLVLAVSPRGHYYVNAARIDPTMLQDAVRAHIKANPGAVVVVNVAPNQKTQALISLLDQVNQIMTETGTQAPIVVATQAVKPAVKSKPRSAAPARIREFPNAAK